MRSYEQVVPAQTHRTAGIDAGLLPTPMAQSRETTQEQTMQRKEKYGGMKRAMYLENYAVMGMLPTPQASDYVGTVQQNNHSLRHLEHGTGWTQKMLPTPTAYDWNTPRKEETFKEAQKRHKEKGVNLQNPLKQMASMGMLPTPTCQDAKQKENSPSQQHKINELSIAVAGGSNSQLNPCLFVPFVDV